METFLGLRLVLGHVEEMLKPWMMFLTFYILTVEIGEIRCFNRG